MPEHHARALLAAALVPIVLAACAGADADAGPAAWAGTVDTLPSGTIVVRNPERGIWDSASAWRVEEELRIGSVDGEGPDAFGDVYGVAADAEGRIWVLDGQAQELRLFDAEGRHVRTVARRGAGPGELRSVGALFAVPGRPEVLVVDYGNQRYARWDSAGRHLGAARRPFGFLRVPFTGGVDSTGAVVEANMIYASDTSPSRDVAIRIDTAGVPTDTVGLPMFAAEMVTVRNERGQPLMSRFVPFTPNLAYHVDPRGYVWSGVSDRYRIVQSSFAGDTVRVIERAATALPVTSEDLAEALEGWEDFERRGGRLDRSRIPKTRPFFARMWTDDRGHLWVHADAPRELRMRAFDVFDPEGRYLGRATAAFDLNHWLPPHIVGDRLYAVVRDSLDVPYVVRARITGR